MRSDDGYRWGDDSRDARDLDRWLTRNPADDRDPQDDVDVLADRLDRAARLREVELSEPEIAAAVTSLRSAAADSLVEYRVCISARHGRACRSRDLDHDCNIPY